MRSLRRHERGQPTVPARPPRGGGRLAGAAALSIGAIAALVGAYRQFGPGPDALAAPPPPGRSAAWYATYGEEAAARGRTEDALAAARLETEADPGSAAAWTRLAHTATLAAGAPTREALGALREAIDAEPFPPPDATVWRVAYAERYWAALPDPLARDVVAQIAVLGDANTAWDARIAWCAGSTVQALAAAACATTPGVERGVWLKEEGGASGGPGG